MSDEEVFGAGSHLPRQQANMSIVLLLGISAFISAYAAAYFAWQQQETSARLGICGAQFAAYAADALTEEIEMKYLLCERGIIKYCEAGLEANLDAKVEPKREP